MEYGLADMNKKSVTGIARNENKRYTKENFKDRNTLKSKTTLKTKTLYYFI